VTDRFPCLVLSSAVVEYVGEWLNLQSAEAARASKSSLFGFGSAAPAPAYCRNASTYLIKQSLTHASEHAVGRRRKENENLSWIMQLPIDSKRNYHDGTAVRGGRANDDRRCSLVLGH
jgi:hypothetical protein